MQQSAIVMQPVQHFDSNNPKYRCCCSNCHVARGAQIIGIIEAICLGISLLNSLIRMGQYGSVYGGQLAGTIISNIISGIAIGLMLYGLKKERPGFLLPHLVLQVVGMIAMLVIAIVVIVALAIGSGEMIAGFIGQNSEQLSQHDRDVIASAVVIAGVICIVMLVICVAFQIWFFTVILAAYKFLKEKEMYVPKQVTMPVMQNDAPPPYPGYQTQYNKQ